MSGKSFGFQDQLRVGDRGEELFIQYYYAPLVIIPDRFADFRRVDDGRSVELKTDTYNMEKTPNFFFERYSDMEAKKPGGPWRARRDRVDIFCYLFSRHNTYFEFTDITSLCETLDDITSKMKPTVVKNRGWLTTGYAVPRDTLQPFYTKYTFTVNVDDESDDKEVSA